MASASEHAQRVEHALSGDAAAQQAVVASWRRSSLLHQLDPERLRKPQMLLENELRDIRGQMEPLVHISSATLDQLYQAVGDVGCCVLLADQNGVPIDRRGSDVDDETFYQWGLWTGSVWSEEVEGTNGIGTCIAEERTLTIHKDQHFHTKNTALSCTAAPIFDHNGNLMAAIDVSSCRADLTAAFSRLIAVAVSEAAHRIETENFRMAFPKAHIVLASEEANHVSGLRRSAALLAVDDDELVIGATRRARRLYDLKDEDLKSTTPLAQVFGSDQLGGSAFAEAERRVVQQALARHSGNVSAAARAIGVSRATMHRKMKRLGVSSH